MRHVGIDVSKKTLQVCSLNPPWQANIPNNARGHQQIIARLSRDSQPVHVVLEATASYGLDVTKALAQAPHIDVMVVNPRAAKSFAKALDQRGKTDGMDATMLARFAAAMPFKRWLPPPEPYSALRQLMRRRRQVVQERTAEKVRLEEARAGNHTVPFVLLDIEETISFLDHRVKAIQREALAHVCAHPDLAAWFDQLRTIPGVADITALDFMAELGCLPQDMDVRQLTAYAGLDPQPFQSGTMDASRRISKRGNKRLRTALYLAAINTTRHSTHVSAWRQRLIGKGKPPKLANIAVARRLLHAIVGMRKSGTDWDGTKFYAGAA